MPFLFALAAGLPEDKMGALRNMKADIRAVYEEELEACANAVRSSFITVAKDFGLTKENCPTNAAFIEPARLRQDLEKGNLMFRLAAGEETAGFMQLENGGDGCCFLKNVAVIPKYRHMGYGKALLDFAKEKAKELGVDVIKIGIIEENTVLKQWYMRNGFLHIGTKKFEHLPFTVGFMEAKLY